MSFLDNRTFIQISHKYKHTQTLLYMIMGTINGHKRTSKLFIKKKGYKNKCSHISLILLHVIGNNATKRP